MRKTRTIYCHFEWNKNKTFLLKNVDRHKKMQYIYKEKLDDQCESFYQIKKKIYIYTLGIFCNYRRVFILNSTKPL